MEFTIVMACLPTGHDADVTSDGSLVLIVEAGATEPAAVAGATEVASFDVEGVIVGDERSFDRARFVRVADDEVLAALVEAAAADEVHVLVVDPAIDRLVDTIVTAPTATAS